jgi:hypothetical protein
VNGARFAFEHALPTIIALLQVNNGKVVFHNNSFLLASFDASLACYTANFTGIGDSFSALM